MSNLFSSQVNHDARRKGTTFEFSIVYPDQRLSGYKLRPIGTTQSGKHGIQLSTTPPACLFGLISSFLFSLHPPLLPSFFLSYFFFSFSPSLFSFFLASFLASFSLSFYLSFILSSFFFFYHSFFLFSFLHLLLNLSFLPFRISFCPFLPCFLFSFLPFYRLL